MTSIARSRKTKSNERMSRPPVIIFAQETNDNKLQMIRESNNDLQQEEMSITSNDPTIRTRPAACVVHKQTTIAEHPASPSARSLPGGTTGQHNPEMMLANKKFAVQQALQRESMKMLQKMRSELINLKNRNNKLQSENKKLKESTEKMMETNITSGNTLADLVENSKELTQKKAVLLEENEALKKELRRYEALFLEGEEQ